MSEINTHDPFNRLGRPPIQVEEERPPVVEKPKRAYVRRPVASSAPGKPEVKVESTLVAACYSTGELMIRVGAKEILLTAAQHLELDVFMANWRRQDDTSEANGAAKTSRGRPRRICGGCGARLSEVRFDGASTICNECMGKT